MDVFGIINYGENAIFERLECTSMKIQSSNNLTVNFALYEDYDQYFGFINTGLKLRSRKDSYG